MIKIAIIDSGVNTNHKVFSNHNLTGYSLKIDSNGNVVKEKDFNDQNGHGTAVYYLISKLTKEIANDIHIDNIRIYYGNTQHLDQNAFEKILNYIAENGDYTIINLSMGITCCNSVKNMQTSINQLHNKGTIVISAFDNYGAVSFPAGLKNVMGIDGDETIKDSSEFRKVENSIVNAVGKIQNIKVAWTNPEYNIVKGNSFTCCYFTAYVAKQIAKDGYFIENKLYTNVISFENEISDEIGFELGKMAVFPFNKEIHSLAQYERQLTGTITHFYSSKFLGGIGVPISSNYKHINNDRIIENIDKIDWDDFDTLVLGHIGHLSDLCGINYRQKLVSEAIAHNKNIYSFDDLTKITGEIGNIQNSKIYFPHINSRHVRQRFGKMYKSNTPIVCFSGTSSAQGKFTLQLFVRQKLIEAGYHVGQLGTEPSSYLFGFDKCFPCGYMSTVSLKINEVFSVVNQMIWDISQKNNDIILAGTQSSLASFSNHNVKMFPTFHQLFYEALQPDIIVLCINPFDSLEYISRNIKIAEGLSFGKVIAIVCFPLDYDLSWKGNFGKKNRITENKEEELRKKIKDVFGINFYMLDKENQLIKLINDILLFLSNKP